MSKKRGTWICALMITLTLYLGLFPDMSFGRSSRWWQNCVNGKAANCTVSLQGFPTPFDLDLRGGGNALQIAETMNSATFDWFGNSLYQNHPQLGPLFATLSETTPSIGTLTSNDLNGDPFFPAEAVNDLYFELYIQAMDLHVFTKEPLHLVATANNFFETDTVFSLEDTVTIYKQNDTTGLPDVEIGEFHAGSEVTAFPSRDISVERRQLSFDDYGGVTAEWDVQNLSGTPMDVYWTINKTSGVHILSAASGINSLGTVTPLSISVSADVVDRDKLQELVLNVSKTSGPLSYGYDVVIISPSTGINTSWLVISGFLITAMGLAIIGKVLKKKPSYSIRG